MFKKNIAIILFLIAQIFYLVNGHGRLLKPDPRTEQCRNNQNQIISCRDRDWTYCDFITNQYYYRGGKCHVCGDNTRKATETEYALNGDVTRSVKATYNSGAKISMTAVIGNHGGYMRVRLCKLAKATDKVTLACLNNNLLRLEVTAQSHYNGTNQVTQLDTYTLRTPYVGYGFQYNSVFNVYLPIGLDCENCVLQWEWHTTDQVAYCRAKSGTMMGNAFNADYNDSPCITQIFRSCSDIKINKIANQPALKTTPFAIKNKEPVFSCFKNRNERSSGAIQKITTADPLNINTAHGMVCIMDEAKYNALTGNKDDYLKKTFCPNCYNNCFLPGKPCPADCFCRWYKKYS